MKKTSILRQLLIPVLAILIILTSVIVGAVIRIFKSSYIRETNSQNMHLTGYLADAVGLFIDSAYSLTEEIANNSDIISMQTDLQTRVLQNTAAHNGYIETMYIQGLDGEQTGRLSGSLGNRKNRWWFKQLLETQKPFISPSYYSIDTDMPCVSIFYPIAKEDEIIGNIGVDVRLDYIQSLVKNYTEIPEAKYSFIIDGNGVVVAHPDDKYIKELYNYKNMTRTVSAKNADGTVLRDSYGNIPTQEESLDSNLELTVCITNLLEGKSGTSRVYLDGVDSFIAYVPIKMKGDSSPWGVITVQSKENAFKTMNSIVRIVILTGLVCLCIAIFMVVTLAKSLTNPIRKIVPAIENLAKGKFDFNIEPSKWGNEIDSITLAVNDVGKKMQRYIAELTATTAEKERLSAELDVATKIQAEMLPRVFPPYEDHPEVELYASMEPAKEVGGDFYDFYMIDDDHFAVVVGDVSGKGVPAALFMVITKTLIKDMSTHSLHPAEIFRAVNTILCEGNESGLFVTCWMGVLTLSTGEFEFSNAGHASPILYANDTFEYLVTKPDLMLAAMEGVKYKSHKITLTHGDRLFIYTDGVTEATNIHNELYGEARLLNIMKKTRNLSSKELLSVVRKDIIDFEQGANQFDDVTMLEMAFKGN